MPGASSAARRRDRRSHGLLKQIYQIFASALYQCSAVRKSTEVTIGLNTTSVTDDVIDWPIPKNLLTALLPDNPITLATIKSGSMYKYKM